MKIPLNRITTVVFSLRFHLNLLQTTAGIQSTYLASFLDWLNCLLLAFLSRIGISVDIHLDIDARGLWLMDLLLLDVLESVEVRYSLL